MSDYFPDNFIENLKASADIVAVVSDYVKLKKTGSGYKGRCPFHSEKTPSFNVNNVKGMFYCFGCGAGGDVFAFVQKYEKVDFPEAVRIVASKSGVALPEKKVRSTAKGELDLLREIMNCADSYFRRTLLDSKAGREAKSYLKSRNISDETIESVGIGFAPAGWNNLKTYLIKKGYSLSNLQKSGLIIRNREKQRDYDRFRKRIIFPITDLSGRTIAFGGRAIGNDEPKYLNSPETPLYNKSSNLYGIYIAKESIKKKDHCIIVEGYFDCIRLYQEGITNVVASLGTAFSEGHARLLGRFTKKVVVNFDPDKAGINAAKRSFEILLSQGFKVNSLILPNGDDPDDYVREYGADSYREQLRSSLPFMEFILNDAASNFNIASSEGKVMALNSVLPCFSKIPNMIDRMDSVRIISDKLKIDDDILLSEIRKALQAGKREVKISSLSSVNVPTRAEEGLLWVVMSGHDSLTKIIDELDSEFTEKLVTADIWKQIRLMVKSGTEINFKSVLDKLEDESSKALLSRISFLKKLNMSDDEVDDYINSLKLIKFESLMKKLQIDIEKAVRACDDTLCAKLIMKKEEIRKKINNIS